MVNRQRIEDAYRLHRSELVRYAQAHQLDEATAQDIVQDAFLRLLQSTDPILSATLRSLLFTTTHRLAIDILRRRQQHAAYCRSQMGWAMDCVDNSTLHTIMCHSIAEAERQQVERLTERRRLVYQLNRYEGLTADDIAKQLQLSRRTVDATLYQSRQQVRDGVRRMISPSPQPSPEGEGVYRGRQVAS